jgi:hypothetical protein
MGRRRPLGSALLAASLASGVSTDGAIPLRQRICGSVRLDRLDGSLQDPASLRHEARDVLGRPNVGAPMGWIQLIHVPRTLDEYGDEWLFLDDHGALIRPCDLVGCRLGLLPAGVLLDHALAVVDVPHIVLLIDPDR